ncbi:exosome complex component RRP45-like [Gigantopelta aegis]|uniref:exosome complex component RRP45-like n=1 Tax=Gigantopelta aegis TaxID=1735272 RepID=UPI001B88A0B1|nr:exosome complex component RRP45-like [Gigantopelta aegis]
MRETPLSTCEKEFILKIIADKKRLDGRQTYDYRKIRISFGIDRGSCQVQIGDTRVLAQVSSEITVPKPTRPTDGILFVNVELSPMASPSFEPGRQSEFGVELTRLLERCLKESRCIDTESLCIVAGQKVWSIRVDVHALNHGGNLLDCASMAAITALAHFRRPDVTVSGEEVTVHPPEDRDPVPLSIHHMPVCVSFAFFEQGKFLLVDPSLKEEKVMDGKMVIGMNKHREICMLQITGEMLLLKDQVLRCSNVAVVKVTEITELIQKALLNDKKERESGGKCGFADSADVFKINVHQTEAQDVEMNGQEVNRDENNMETGNGENGFGDSVKVSILGKGLAVIGEGGPNTWDVDEDIEEELQEEGEVTDVNAAQQRKSKSEIEQRVQEFLTRARKETDVHSSEDSEEESVVVLQDVEGSSQSKMRKIPEQIDLTGSAIIDLTKSQKSEKSTGKNPKTKKKKRK